ncbi:pirin family protein [Acidicapsa ligni]|uniref:pirin family protein n=1 Tax=Acidicapsa ligni TaxID=542300 RepID=UPI0021DF8DAA|nr:pirin family protein [Acidicapsa ligni]
MLTVRKSKDRGHANHGWLDSKFSFSFADYYDPKSMGFRALRVINEDVISGGGGFGTHGHKEMEIVTYVLDGGVAHQDSLGSGSVIVPGELQHMSAGTGIRHSEYNASKTDPAHMLQIWLLPSKAGVAPVYSQQKFPIDAEHNLLHLLVSPDGHDGSLAWNTDAELYATKIDANDRVEHAFTRKHGWVQVARGSAIVNGEELSQGDGLAISEEVSVSIVAGQSGTEVLFFELS